MVSAAKAAMKHQDKALWVIVEPRSNTMRSNVHQQRLPQCFSAADTVIFTPPSHRNLADDAVLDLQAVCQAIGQKAHMMNDTQDIIEYIVAHAHDGDDVLILSNGGFENIHQRLLQAMQEKASCTH